MKTTQPTSMSLRVLVAGLLAVFAPGLTFAERHENLERGFLPDKVYQVSDVDSVSLFNGNRTIVLPVGGSTRVNGSLDVAFTLSLSSNVWDFEQLNQNPNPPYDFFTQAIPDRNSNAGMGWMFSLGGAYLAVASTSKTLQYVSPDGGDHSFYATLHSGETETDPTSVYSYTRDGTYLRRNTVARSLHEIQFPDGRIQTYQLASGKWRLASIRDAYGFNWVSVNYDDPSKWQITDSLGRSYTVTFHTSGDFAGNVSSVVLPGFDGTEATYTFGYTRTEIHRSLKDNDPATGPTLFVPFLTSIGLPDGSSYEMKDPGGDPWYYTDHTGLDGSSGTDLSGVLNHLRLPTGGRVAWQFDEIELPSKCLSSPEDLQDPVYAYALAVTRRTLETWSGTAWTEVGSWDYRHINQPALNPLDKITIVRAPSHGTEVVQDETIHHFRTQWCVASEHWDFGLPYTKQVADGSRYLSTEWFSGLVTPPNSYSYSTTNRKRHAFVAYDRDPMPLPGDAPLKNTNRRAWSGKTVYDDDGSRVAESTETNFDGLGHYRTSTTGGTFGAGDVRTTTTTYNPVSGVFQGVYNPGPPGTYTPWPVGKPWVLHTYTTSTANEGGSVAKTEACFEQDAQAYPTTGYLLRTRTLKTLGTGGAEPQRHAADLIARYTRNAFGDTILEEYFGGDTQSVSYDQVVSLCAVGLPAESKYRIDHEYPFVNGTTWTPQRRSRYSTSGGGSVGFYTLDLDIDQNTALVTTSRDTAGRATDFTYDAMRRLTWEMPAAGNNGAWTEVVYWPWSGAINAWVDVIKHLNNSATGVLAEQKYSYDGFGRLVAEASLLPLTGFNQRLTTYNAMGWKTSGSEWQPIGTIGTSLRLTEFRNFDPFGRPGTIRPADGLTHDTTLTYTGIHKTSRTVQIATAVGSESPATTEEWYDRQGRLWKVREPSGTSGGIIETIYAYDVGGRLRQASTTSGTTTQTRTFTYDGRGFPLSEDIPEKTIPAGFSHDVTHASYDARGHALRITDGPNDLALTYDRAERVTQVSEAVGYGRVLRVFEYDTIGGVQQGSSLGKLVRSTGNNYFNPIPTINFQVKETLTYNGRDGRVSARLTEAGETSLPLNAFTQSFEWSQLGAVSSLTYPNLSGTALAPSRLVSNAREYGYLTGVSDGSATYASSITYHPNGLIDTLTHGNGTKVVHGKDLNDMARPASITLQRVLGGAVLWETGAYAYDGAGNVKAMGADTFTYDRVSRLVKGNLTSIPRQQCASFDAFGNITGLNNVATGTTCTPSPISVDTASNRLGSPSTYDAAGQMTRWGPDTLPFDYQWYPTGQMRQMNGSGRWTMYGYAADGERLVWYDDDEKVLHYTLRDLSGKVLREYAQNQLDYTWSWKKDYVYRDGLLLATIEPPLASPIVKHVHLDHLGNVRRLTNTSGTVVGTRNFLPFGQLWTDTASTERMAFTGHERDLRDPINTTDDLDDMHARYYNPNIARFLAVDQGKPKPRAPQSWNRFAYVQGNPTKLVDLDGEDAIDFVNGLANAFGSDMLLGAGRLHASNGDYAAGQAVGDTLAVVAGSLEATLGLGGNVLGLSLDATGAGAVLGLPVNAASTAMVVQGAGGAATGALNLVKSARSSLADVGDSVNKGDVKRVSDGKLKRLGVSPHKVKGEVVGKKHIAQWDIGEDKKGNSYLISKDGKVIKDLHTKLVNLKD